ncbi:MAG TPA: DNA primase [Verrucomicrobiae bacterium]|nr:DNA primase [Verrucomicrobiae bacterium]
MGGISDSTREQIRAASDVVEIIGAIVPLKRAGANWIGLCPFHREKTPSFNVSPSRQMFRCFGCGKGGDVFRFVMDYESITFPEAMRRLAERAHIVIEEDNTPGASDSRALKDKLLTIHEQITQRWQNALTTDAGSQVARDYIAKRRVPEEMVKLFRIGYAPDSWEDTVNWARSKNFDLELVAQAGLIIKRDGGEGYYDRFRGRLMFPICDEQGRVVAFSGRVLSGDEKTAKYVNSPETPIFTKGRIIFGLDKAKRAILDRQVAVVCEGQLDMIACYGAGVENTVAPQGTAFTAEHARILKRYTKEVVLCFDSDNAGQKAAVRALDDLIHSGLAIRVATMPQPHDPDSYVKELGAEAFNELIAKAVGFFDFYLDLLCKQNDVRSDRGQKEVARAMSVALDKANDPMLFERYARKTAARLGADPVQAINAFKKLAKETPQQRSRADYDDDALPQEPEQPAMARPSHPELWILKLALLDELNLEWLVAHLDFQWIEHAQVRTILEHRLTQREDGLWPSPAELVNDLEDAAAQNLLTEASTDPLKLADPANVLRETLLRLRNVYIDRQLILVASQMADVNADLAELVARQKALRVARTAPLTPVSDASEF